MRKSLPFDEEGNSHTLLDIENIFVLRPVGGLFLFLAIPMQIKNIDIVEALHQALAHTTECWVVEIAMVSNESKDTIASPLNTPLGKTKKFDVVITQPFCLGRLLQLRASILVCLN